MPVWRPSREPPPPTSAPEGALMRRVRELEDQVSKLSEIVGRMDKELVDARDTIRRMILNPK